MRRASLLVLAVAALVGAFVVGRVTSPSAPAPSPVDIGFSQDMAVHHQQAVLMSTLAGTRSGPGVKAFADSILSSQSQELGVLRGWLQLWGQPAESMTPMLWMSPQGHAGMHHPMPMPADGVMPGMASPDELTSLWTKTGRDFDVSFLQLMIRHHQGGVEMARYGAAHATLGTTRQAAEAMAYQQTEEIGQMQAVLATYGAAPLPFPTR
ncbi:DUF305 domain-containing protein [Pseudonocardia spinosispora]|uniref:DUF305 domain-containing protein n=1 Tax=Pseudonocardia spinosispora TaxID=103441 RepID=UPI0003FF4F58|nr:DUF305 domain-containing protein [Pseudonocardia spinosispora]